MKLSELFQRYHIWDQMREFLPQDADAWEVSVDPDQINATLEAEERVLRERVAEIPLLLAYAYQEMHRALHPVIKLSWMVNLSELCLRWSATLLISEIAESEDHTQLPTWCQSVLRYHIERPTLGSWVHILRELTREALKRDKRRKSHSLWALHDRIKHHFARDQQNLIHIRNQFAHDGITADSAQEVWRVAKPQIEALITAVMDATRDGIDGGGRCTVIAVHDRKRYWLMGEESQEVTSAELKKRLGLKTLPDALRRLKQSDRFVGLVSARGHLRILPYFVVFGQIEEDKELPVIQIYAKLDHKRVAFTPIQAREATIYLDHVRQFESFLGLSSTSQLSPINGHTYEDYVLAHHERYQEELCGREIELDIISHWLLRSRVALHEVERSKNTSDLITPQLGWIGGRAGMGKSHLLSHLAHRLHQNTLAQQTQTVWSEHQNTYDTLPPCPVFYHRFELDDLRCHIDVCLRLLAQRLHQHFYAQLYGLEERFHQLHYSELSGDALEDYLSALLGILKPLESALTDVDLIIILDAIDLLELESKGEDETSPMTALLDVFERLTRVGDLDLRALISTSHESAPFTSGRRRPQVVLAQSEALAQVFSTQRDRFKAYKQRGAVEKYERDLERLERLQSGAVLPLDDRQVRSLLTTTAGSAYAAAINELGKDKQRIRDNPFLCAVLEASGGSPLYLQLVLEELERGRLSISSTPELPSGVEAYFFNMLQRVDFGDGTRSLPLVLCLLLIARRELSEYAIAQLVSKRAKPSSSERKQVNALLAQMEHIFTRRDEEGERYWQLQNSSLKSTLGASSPLGPAQLQLTYREALDRFMVLSADWRALLELPTARERSLARHILTFDVDYTMQRAAPHAIRALIGRFTTLDYILAYLDESPIERVGRLAEVYARLRRVSIEGKPPLKRERGLLEQWERFFRQNRVILERPRRGVSASQITLQLALDDARRSPITASAERWVKRNPGRFKLMRLAPTGRREYALSSALRSAHQLESSVRRLEPVGSQLFLCVSHSQDSSAPAEVTLYHARRGRVLWRRAALDARRTLDVIVLARSERLLSEDETTRETTLDLALWSASEIELTRLHVVGMSCVETLYPSRSAMNAQSDTTLSFTPPPPAKGESKLNGVLALSVTRLLGWESGRAHVWDWSQEETRIVTFKVSKFRAVVALDPDRIIAHQGKLIELIAWELTTGEVRRETLATLGKRAFTYGALYTLPHPSETRVLIISGFKKSEPPQLDWVALPSHDPLIPDDASPKGALSATHHTLKHPHQTWVTGALIPELSPRQDLGDATLYLSDQDLITRWSIADFTTQEMTPLPTFAEDEALLGAAWVGTTPVWYGKRGLLLAYGRAERWIKLDDTTDDSPHPDRHLTAIQKITPLSESSWVSASDDNDLRLWSLSDGKRAQIVCQGLWRGHSDRVLQAQVILDDQHPERAALISASTSKQLYVWSMEPRVIKRALTLSREAPRYPFIKSALAFDKRWVLAGHQGLKLTLWTYPGAQLHDETHIESSLTSETLISELYALPAPDPHDAVTDYALVVTQKSNQSYLYALPTLERVATMSAPRAISSHLTLTLEHATLFFNTFDSPRKSATPEDEQRAREIWIWTISEGQHSAPAIFDRHQAPPLGVMCLHDDLVISWDTSGVAYVWRAQLPRRLLTRQGVHEVPPCEPILKYQFELFTSAPHQDESPAQIEIKGVKLSPERRRILAWDKAGRIALWSRAPRGAKFKASRLSIPEITSVDDARFLDEDTVLITKRRVGVWLISGEGALLQHVERPPIHDQVVRARWCDDHSILLYEKRRPRHVWRWSWAHVTDTPTDTPTGHQVEHLASDERSPAFTLLHKDEALKLSDLSRGSTHPWIETQSDQLTLVDPASNTLRHWYSADGNSWGGVAITDEHLIFKMNRALYPVVINPDL